MIQKFLFILISVCVISSQTAYSQNYSSINPDKPIRLKLSDKSVFKDYLRSNLTNIPLSDSTKIKPKDTKQYKLHPVRLSIVGAGMLGTFTAMNIYYNNTWWKDKVHYFKFAEDGYYARNVDKASHVYTANVFTELTAALYEWSGISPGKSLLWGAITAMAYETYIEINDGLSPNWGFDWGDMAANFTGALYPVFQRMVPALQDINVKWSFKPEWLKGKLQNKDDLLDDYTNMTFWLSVNPEMFFSKSVTQRKWYPSFLAIALGVSIKNASHVNGSTNAYREWFISLDYDIRKLPGNSDFMKKFKKILNFYHFPAPAIKFSPNGVWYGLYF